MIKPRAHLDPIMRTQDDVEPRTPYLCLDKNERVTPLPDQVFKRFQSLLTPQTVISYPELEPLYQKLSDYLDVDRSHLYLAAGSDIGIKTVYETYISPGDRIVIHNPSYAMQNVYAKIFQAELVQIPYKDDLSFDLKSFLAAIKPGTKLVVVENPNGFTGKSLPLADVKKIVEKAQACGAIALLDEAYYLFSEQSLLPLYAAHDNVIISRTFSKDLGMAGLRCAYLLSQPENIESLFHVKPMHEINSAAAAMVQASLEFPESILSYMKDIRKNFKFLQTILEEKGFQTHGGDSNFIAVYVGTATDMPHLIHVLKARGILIRKPPALDALKGWVRVGIGTQAQMQLFANTFLDCLGKSTQKEKAL